MMIIPNITNDDCSLIRRPLFLAMQNRVEPFIFRFDLGLELEMKHFLTSSFEKVIAVQAKEQGKQTHTEHIRFS